MKKYVRSDTRQMKQSEALKSLRNKLKSEGTSCEINKKHHCLDVFDETGMLIKQIYAKEDGKVPAERAYYEYVGPGQGDYKRLTRDVQETRYTDENPLIKFVQYTNDPKDIRYKEI